MSLCSVLLVYFGGEYPSPIGESEILLTLRPLTLNVLVRHYLLAITFLEFLPYLVCPVVVRVDEEGAQVRERIEEGARS